MAEQIPVRTKAAGTVSQPVTLDYGFDWKDADDPWLQTSESLATSVWTVPAGITNESDSISDNVAIIWLTGGTAGETYRITNYITTDNATPRKDERAMDITVVEDR